MIHSFDGPKEKSCLNVYGCDSMAMILSQQLKNLISFLILYFIINCEIVLLFLGPYDNSYVSAQFYSTNKNKAFGLNASPESAMSPSISSVATSASEVSEPISDIYIYIVYTSAPTKLRFQLCAI